MSIATSNRVWLKSKHTGSALIVLLALADRADDDGYCWPGMEDIATRSRLDKRQAQRTVKQIEGSGELYAQRFGGRGRTNEYIVTVDQEAQQIANTLVRRFEENTTDAMRIAQEIIQRQVSQIKGDIQGEKVTPTPPFTETIKGDIHSIKGDTTVQKVTLNGDTTVQKVTSSALKGGAHTTRIIINQQEQEDLLSSSSEIDFFTPKNAEEKTMPASPTAPGSHTPADIWQMALNDLQSSMPAPTYETWLRDTSALSYEDGDFVIGVPHAYARDWLTGRLRPQIKRILSRLLQRSTEVTFAVRERPTAPGA